MAQATGTTVRHPLADAEQAVAVASQLRDEFAPGAADRDRSGAVPVDELARWDASGLPSLTVPREYGGAGLGPVVLAETTRLVAAADPALAQSSQAHYLAVDVLRACATTAQRESLFPMVVSGQRVALILAERGGHHAQDLKTRLRRGPDGWWLEGKKYYSTGAITSGWLGVSALDDDDRLVLVFVPRHADGVTIDEDWTAMGQRATVSGTTTLSRVGVDPAMVVDYWRLFERPQSLGARAQLVHTAIEVGIAEGALSDAAEFVRTRSRPFFEAVRVGLATSAADDPHTLLRFGQLTTRVTAARQLLRWAAGEVAGLPLQPASAADAARGSLAVAQAKAFACDAAVDVASQLFALTGASGTDRRFDLDRHWRNARTHSLHDPVDWKYRNIGAWELSGTLPPNHGQL